MSLIKKIYLSPLGWLISHAMNMLSTIHRPFMVYGIYNYVEKKRMRFSRISSSTKILHKSKLDIADHVWIGHFSVLDASNGLKIGQGVQTGSHISIYSHSSHTAIRLLGNSYLEMNERPGYVKGYVSIGDFAFIGDSVVIFPGVVIGKGALIKAGSVVTHSIPDYSIAGGIPATVCGSVFDLDHPFLEKKMDLKKTYFDYQAYLSYLEEK